MIISLVVVLGLQGADGGQLVLSKDEEALKKAFIHCVDSKSYSCNNLKRPIKVYCFKETNNKDEIHNLTKKVIDNECKNLDVRFSNFANVYLYSGANAKIKNAESEQWIDQDHTNEKRATICTIYNITSENMQQDLKNINKFIDQNKRVPLLVTGTSSDFITVFKVLETEATNFNLELASELTKLSKELIVEKIDEIRADKPSLEELLQQSDELTFNSKVLLQSNNKSQQPSLDELPKQSDALIFNSKALLQSNNKSQQPSLDELSKQLDELTFNSKALLQSNNNKSQPSYIAIAKNFFTNRWVMAGGFSLAAFFIYCYKLVR
jgi:hypothetical protein